MIKKITKQYATVSQLIANNYTEIIGICTDNKRYYFHERRVIYDYINPMSPYKDARIINGALCIII